jgi:hypothetical protein
MDCIEATGLKLVYSMLQTTGVREHVDTVISDCISFGISAFLIGRAVWVLGGMSEAGSRCKQVELVSLAVRIVGSAE